MMLRDKDAASEVLSLQRSHNHERIEVVSHKVAYDWILLDSGPDSAEGCYGLF
jgi:hypothetical protein